MKHLGTKTLETKRLVLRPFTMNDAGAMFKNWTCDKEVTKYLTWPAHESVEQSRSVLIEWTGRYDEEDFYQWAIVLKDNGDEPVGSISVVKKDNSLQMVHIGYCIGRTWWNQGITSEALGELIRFFFMEVGVNRVESRHDPNNPNSGKVMLKCGMRLEGTMRQADRNNQGICDYAEYGILAEEYKQAVPPRRK
jgi:ribosomal-protein-alanine N-acetyltransferase